MISQAIFLQQQARRKLTTRATEALVSTTTLRTLYEVKGDEATKEEETNESFQERIIIFEFITEQVATVTSYAAHRRRQTMTLEAICDPSFDFLVLIFGPISIIFNLFLFLHGSF